MSDHRYSEGLYICDGCDAPVESARLILLLPNAMAAANFKDQSNIRGVVAAFCKTCNTNEEVVAKVTQAMATQYNEWVVKQTQ